MDCENFQSILNQKCELLGIDAQYVNRKETLYFDESGNIKHLIVKNGKLNAPEDTVFVLGGVQAEEAFSQEDLQEVFGKEKSLELKSNKLLKGNFVEILKKEIFTKVWRLIDDKNWNIHFTAVQCLYYGFVDIIDSCDYFVSENFQFKAILYNVLKRDPGRTTNIFRLYKYPNIKDNQIAPFLDELIKMIDEQIKLDSQKQMLNPLLIYMRNCFEDIKKSKKGLTYVQGYQTHIWVDDFVQFYRQIIWMYPNKTLIFDEEKQVQSILEQENLEIGGKKLTQYKFVDSQSYPLIQVSDLVVSILRKYFVFLDRSENDVQKDISSFSEVQKTNFKLLNHILKKSVESNPMFVDFTGSIYTYNKYVKYLNY